MRGSAVPILCLSLGDQGAPVQSRCGLLVLSPRFRLGCHLIVTGWFGWFYLQRLHVWGGSPSSRPVANSGQRSPHKDSYLQWSVSIPDVLAGFLCCAQAVKPKLECSRKSLGKSLLCCQPQCAASSRSCHCRYTKSLESRDNGLSPLQGSCGPRKLFGGTGMLARSSCQLHERAAFWLPQELLA